MVKLSDMLSVLLCLYVYSIIAYIRMSYLIDPLILYSVASLSLTALTVLLNIFFKYYIFKYLKICYILSSMFFLKFVIEVYNNLDIYHGKLIVKIILSVALLAAIIKLNNY